MLKREGEVRIPSGCAISAIIDRGGARFSGADIIESIALMHDRSNGLGGGFAAYGIYPEHKEYYAFHIFYDDNDARVRTEEFLFRHFDIETFEQIPTRKVRSIHHAPLIWRYFGMVPQSKMRKNDYDADEYTARCVIRINNTIPGAFVFSSGKNMGAFKAVGYPEDPFTLLDWSIVHNGEISSYDANRRYVEQFGYKCNLQTDTEVITYLFDLLVRRQGLTLETAAKVLAAPEWDVIDRMPDEEREICTALRAVYSGALINGPFSILVGFKQGILALNDRLKLRSLIQATKGSKTYFASEESAIRVICPDPESIAAVDGGTPVFIPFAEVAE